MLTGKLVRVRHARNKLVPLYLKPHDPEWQDVAARLLDVYRAAAGCTRGEIAEDLVNYVGDGPGQLVHQGLAKLLEDRCEFEVAADLPPEQVRDAAFRAAADYRKSTGTFARDVVLRQAAAALGVEPDAVERSLFADLKDEQRCLKFADCSAEFLVNRYNVSLAQAVVMRAVGVRVRVWGESPARFRQLFRAVKFHRLICAIKPVAAGGYALSLDGPLSLFSATQKYGFQLAMFLPTLLHCKAFELDADVRWGAEKKEKTFALSALDGLKTHAADFGTFAPKEFDLFAESFRTTVEDWTLTADPNPVTLPDGIWVPDFTLTHAKTKAELYLELFGFWRRTDIDALYRRLDGHIPGKFILAVSEQMKADDSADADERPGLYRYKRTPSADAVAKVAAGLIGGARKKK